MSDESENAEWRMTEEAIPERPDDCEWRKGMALRLLTLAFLVVLMGVAAVINVKWSVMVGTVLMPALAAVSFHFRRHRGR